jgi:hypothetical protein
MHMQRGESPRVPFTEEPKPAPVKQIEKSFWK